MRLKLKQTNASAHLVQYRFKILKAVRKESERTKGFMKEMSFQSGVKGRWSDRWRERRWRLWWGDMRRYSVHQKTG